MSLSIIVVSWNTRDLLIQCLSSIFTYPPTDSFDVWVVDNASEDGSNEAVIRHFPQTNLIENDSNVGFATANNQVIHNSKGEYLLLLNPDTEVKPGALETLIQFMDQHKEVGAVGPRLQNSDGSIQVSCYLAPTLMREFWRLFHLDVFWDYSSYPMFEWDLATAREVEVIQGACLLLRRIALDQVGLLDEDYFIYSEEVDLCVRLRRAGFHLFWIPQAEVVHYGGRSTEQVQAEMFIHLYRSKVLYFRKNHGLPKSILYKLILFTATISRLLLSPFTLFERPSTRDRHLGVVRNYCDLLMEIPKM